MTKTTSIHRINGDYQLSKSKKKLYFFLNRVNNIFPKSNMDRKIELKRFKINNLAEAWHASGESSSPSRRLSDTFWYGLPWKGIKEVLKEINVLDIGCGSGNYFLKINEFSEGNIHSYRGIDVYVNENWKELQKKHKNISFVKFEGKSIEQYLNEFQPNFIMSQSAFEHIDDDLHYFKQISDYTNNSKRAVIQIHLLPSAIGLKLYQQHGIRQYTPRNISKITKLFKDDTQIILFELGGKQSNELHFAEITKPMLAGVEGIRENDKAKYSQLVKKAITEDENALSNKEPSFYALVILSNVKAKLF